MSRPQPTLWDVLAGQSPVPATKAERRRMAVRRGLTLGQLAAQKREPLIAALVDAARILAESSGAQGITMADLRDNAIANGILSGREDRATMSAIGVVPHRAGLINSGRYRRSHHASRHGGPQVVWLHPSWQEMMQRGLVP